MRVLDPAVVARAALAEPNLCARQNSGPWYRNPNNPDLPDTCAIGAALTPEERLEAQVANKYEIASLISSGMFSVADPAHIAQLTELQKHHDRAVSEGERAWKVFVDYAESLC